ncbi:MAG TPA: agmatinase family protein [Bryobacteraceae bacterium]|nr:agmatinase family protein [Bryobacteraceae bacterium]
MSVRAIDPNGPSAGEWLAGEHLAKTIGTLTLLGAPVGLGSLSGGRCDLAPQAIRAAVARYSTYDVEFGRDLRALAVHDCGDLKIADLRPEQALAPIREAVSKAVKHSSAVVILGGDNSITYPAAKSATGLLTFDAHFDLGGLDNGLSNGNPIRALLGDGFPGGQIVQVGIQSFANSRAYADVARQSGITFITLDQVRLRGIENVTAEALTQLSNSADFIYVDFDLDVLDRTFAPAASGSRPGGLAPWELRRAARLCGLHPRVRAIDLVEIDPTRDVADATSLAAAACLLSFTSGLHQRLRG